MEMLTVIDHKIRLQAEKLTERHAATLLGVSVSFLRMARVRGTVGGRTPGPAYYRLGKRVLYLRADLERWLAEHRVDRSEHPATSRKRA